MPKTKKPAGIIPRFPRINESYANEEEMAWMVVNNMAMPFAMAKLDDLYKLLRNTAQEFQDGKYANGLPEILEVDLDRFIAEHAELHRIYTYKDSKYIIYNEPAKYSNRGINLEMVRLALSHNWYGMFKFYDENCPETSSAEHSIAGDGVIFVYNEKLATK